ncbi:MAG: hypothetical protein AAGA58_08005 [Verrucomicrobiota bacterium]
MARIFRPMDGGPKRFRPIVQPVVHEESKRETQRSLGWENNVDGTKEPVAKEKNHARPVLAVISGVVLLGIAILAFSNSMSPPAEAPVVEVRERDLFSDFLPYEEVKNGVTEVVTSFLQAKAAEDLKGLIVGEDEIWPSVVDYYEKNAKEYHVVSRVQLALKYETQDGQPEFYLAKAHVAEGPIVPLGVEVSEEGIFVDWESHIGFNPVPVASLKPGKDNAEIYRVIFRKALFFDDEALLENVAQEKGVVLEADLAEREDPVFIFIGDSAEEFERINELAQKGNDHPAMFALYTDSILPENYLIAESFIQFGWVDRQRSMEEAPDAES